jgi:hydrogenase-4 membrane subunit HyfE
MNHLKRFDELIALRPILIASVTFTIGITLTAIAFLVTGINVSTEGTFIIYNTRRAFVSF